MSTIVIVGGSMLSLPSLPTAYKSYPPMAILKWHLSSPTIGLIPKKLLMFNTKPKQYNNIEKLNTNNSS